MILESAIWLWLPLIFSIGAGLARKNAISLVVLGVTLLIAFALGRIDLIALISTFVILIFSYYLSSLLTAKQPKPINYVGLGIVVAWCVMLFMHLIPGFNNFQVLDNVKAGPESLPFSMYLNLDYPLTFFALLLAYPILLGDKKKWQLKPLLITLPLLFSLLPIAAYVGAIKTEFGLPSWWWLFVLNNLLLICVAEEALFRGFIQQSLSRRFDWRIGLAVASILFGLAHYSGGTLLVIFATLAGLGYGLVFHFTNRLWCAVLAHFLFNFVHLIFFTYPVLAR